MRLESMVKLNSPEQGHRQPLTLNEQLLSPVGTSSFCKH